MEYYLTVNEQDDEVYLSTLGLQVGHKDGLQLLLIQRDPAMQVQPFTDQTRVSVNLTRVQARRLAKALVRAADVRKEK